MAVERIAADFGDASDEARLPVVLDDQAVGVGTVVLLFDHEGNKCYGTVESLDGSLAWVDLNWDTWLPADYRRLRAVSNYTVGPSPQAPIEPRSSGPAMTMHDLSDLVANADIADLAGLSDAAVSQWHARFETFPEPLVMVARGSNPLFSRREVVAWIAVHRPQLTVRQDA